MLDGRRVLLVVSGGIAAYKSVILVRRLRQSGARVDVVMTASAEKMVGATTFQALSGRPGADRPVDRAAGARRTRTRGGPGDRRPGHGEHPGEDGTRDRGRHGDVDPPGGRLSGARLSGHEPPHVEQPGDAGQREDAGGHGRPRRGARGWRAGGGRGRSGTDVGARGDLSDGCSPAAAHVTARGAEGGGDGWTDAGFHGSRSFRGQPLFRAHGCGTGFVRLVAGGRGGSDRGPDVGQPSLRTDPGSGGNERWRWETLWSESWAMPRS